MATRKGKLMEHVAAQVESVATRLFQGYLTAHNGRATAQLNPRSRAPRRGFLVLSDVPVGELSFGDLHEAAHDYIHSNWLLASARPGYRVFCLWAEWDGFRIGIQEWVGSFDGARKMAMRYGHKCVWDIRLNCPRTI
jgi:hypothetical protein